MQPTRHHLVFVLLTLCALAGCQSAPKTPDPVIAGDWSQPVNGVRMAARVVVGDGQLLLILAHNTLDTEVEWPGISPEHVVHVQGQEPFATFSDSKNLRIAAEPLEGQPVPRPQQLMTGGGLHQLGGAPLAPGEMRVYAIGLYETLAQHHQAQQTRNAIHAKTMHWEGMSASEGAWRLHLTYRPEGFPPAPGEEVAERWDIDPAWAGQQIDLPPVVVQVFPQDERHREEMNELRER